MIVHLNQKGSKAQTSGNVVNDTPICKQWKAARMLLIFPIAMQNSAPALCFASDLKQINPVSRPDPAADPVIDPATLGYLHGCPCERGVHF